jgi:hypothetical protein
LIGAIVGGKVWFKLWLNTRSAINIASCEGTSISLDPSAPRRRTQHVQHALPAPNAARAICTLHVSAVFETGCQLQMRRMDRAASS